MAAPSARRSISDSSRKAYHQHLATFRGSTTSSRSSPNDVEAPARRRSPRPTSNGWFIEAMFLEPVMGEGNPGMGATPAFYAAARELTRAHGALLLIDSIQAGLRAHGVLSIIDYPGFEGLEAPDMETYSKALNAGQYPAVGAGAERPGRRAVPQGPLRQHHDHQSARDG